jgi:hypothetical protein
LWTCKLISRVLEQVNDLLIVHDVFEADRRNLEADGKTLSMPPEGVALEQDFREESADSDVDPDPYPSEASHQSSVGEHVVPTLRQLPSGSFVNRYQCQHVPAITSVAPIVVDSPLTVH